MGNDAEKQRYRQAQNAIAKIQSNPINEEFRKTLPDNYKPAKVLGQYRLFFKIYRDYDVVFLVWMNDENSIHKSGEKGDSYQVFRDLLDKGEIKTYSPPGPSSEPVVTQHHSWGEQAVYFDLEQVIEEQKQWADSHLYLSQINSLEYRIEAISVSKTDKGFAKTLLLEVCERSKIASVHLYYELDIKKPSKMALNRTNQTCLGECFGFFHSA